MVLHKRKIKIVSSGAGDCIYVVFVYNIGYVRTKSSWECKPKNMPRNTDYHDMLVDIARKAA